MQTASERYERMLYELNALIDAGEGDGEAADDLRERMAVLWRVLTVDQGRRMQRLAARIEALRAGRRKND
jgi:hypothetical protein